VLSRAGLRGHDRGRRSRVRSSTLRRRNNSASARSPSSSGASCSATR
jgi:hypothetical protein